MNIGKGDFGTSIKWSRPVVDIIAERLPMTLELTLLAMLFSTVVGILLGVVSALKRNTIIDTITMIIANIGISMPVFWLGLLLAYVFALLLKGTPFVLPPSGRFSAGVALQDLDKFWGMTNVTGFKKFIIDLMSNTVLINCIFTGNWKIFWDSLKHLILPAVAVGTIPMAIIARMTRSSCSRSLASITSAPPAQGTHRTQGDLQTCHAQCAHPHRHHHRYRNW